MRGCLSDFLCVCMCVLHALTDMTQMQVPTERVTVVLTASDASLLQFTSRIYFRALEQQQTRTIHLSHLGSFRNGSAVISIAAFGGNFEGALLPNALHVPVNSPALLLSTRHVSVKPNAYSTLTVSLDTPPTAPTVITATSSDPAVATVGGPVTATDTSEQTITVTHVSLGTARITFAVSSAAGSTYGNISVGSDVSVAVDAGGPGFRLSSSQVIGSNAHRVDMERENGRERDGRTRDKELSSALATRA